MASKGLAEQLTAARGFRNKASAAANVAARELETLLGRRRPNAEKIAAAEARGRAAETQRKRWNTRIQTLEDELKQGGTAVEFKLAYEAGKKSKHAHLNIRLQKASGDRITLAEAEAAVKRFRERGAVMAGWEMAAISWQSGRVGRWKSGTKNDVDDFRAVIAAAELDLSPGLVGEG
jgi:hypothetical protein